MYRLDSVFCNIIDILLISQELTNIEHYYTAHSPHSESSKRFQENMITKARSLLLIYFLISERGTGLGSHLAVCVISPYEIWYIYQNI
jgi:hypothetical protein